jgi:hypothetical protein
MDWSGRAGIVTLMLEQLQRPSVILSSGWRFCLGYWAGRGLYLRSQRRNGFYSGVGCGASYYGYLVSLLDVMIGQYSRTEGVRYTRFDDVLEVTEKDRSLRSRVKIKWLLLSKMTYPRVPRYKCIVDAAQAVLGSWGRHQLPIRRYVHVPSARVVCISNTISFVVL